jgi:hypothetical protein
MKATGTAGRGQADSSHHQMTPQEPHLAKWQLRKPQLSLLFCLHSCLFCCIAGGQLPQTAALGLHAKDYAANGVLLSVRAGWLCCCAAALCLAFVHL